MCEQLKVHQSAYCRQRLDQFVPITLNATLSGKHYTHHEYFMVTYCLPFKLTFLLHCRALILGLDLTPHSK